jgi:hypothetical protein
MLIVNLSDTLVNGRRGTVKEMKGETVVVHFCDIDTTVEIQKHLFTVYDIKLKQDVATRLQIPLKLGYAFTVHKAQGLTLDSVEIDCRNMNFPGQLGVAIGRATTTEGLRVINFDKCYLKKQPTFLQSYYESESEPILENLECCRKPIHYEDIGNLGCESSSISHITENLSDSDFDDDFDIFMVDSPQAAPVEDFPEVFQMQNLPDDIDLRQVIRTDMYHCPETENQVFLNADLDYLLSHFPEASTFAKQIWKRLKDIFKSSIPGDGKSVGNKHMTNYHKDVVLFLSTDAYKRMVANLFSTSSASVSSRQFRAAYTIVEELRKRVVMEASEGFIRQSQEEAAHDSETKQFKGSEAGKAKVRYIAGWCVASLKHSKKEQVKRNLYKNNAMEAVKVADQEVRHLEELIVTEEEIFQCTTDISSLMEVKRKQNIRQGLTNVTDRCFQFFLQLDQEIRKLETIKNLHIHSKQLYTFTLDEINECQSLKETWKALFGDTEHQHGTVLNLFDQIVAKYVRMSSNQFKKEVNRMFAVEKEKAHRKKVLQKKEKIRSCGNWSLERIYSDKSMEKISSHRFIQSQLEANSKFLIEGPFQKKHLLTLCDAYAVSASKNATKQAISDKLKQVILSSEKMLHPGTFQSQTTESTSTQQGDSAEPSGSASELETIAGPSSSTTHLESIAGPSSSTSQLESIAGPSSSTSQLESIAGPSSSTSQLETIAEPSISTSSQLENTAGPSSSTTSQPGNSADILKTASASVIATDIAAKRPTRKRKGIRGVSKSKGKRLAKKSRTIHWPCGICEEECLEEAVCCDSCDTWHHFQCLFLDKDDDQFTAEEWICPSCASTD